MRIAFDAKRAFHNFSGLGNYSRFIIEGLSKHYPENQYLLYTPHYEESPQFDFAKNANIQIELPSGIWNSFHGTWRTYKITGRAQRDGANLYHGLSHELPVGIENSGIKSLVTIHDLIFLRYPHYYSAIDRGIYKQKFLSACKRANLVLAISRQTRSDLINFFNIPEEKIRLVYQGCDLQFQEEVTQEKKEAVKVKYNLPEKYILSVGTIESRKNLATVVKAMEFLPADMHLVAVGKPTSYINKVKEEIEKLGLGERVMFLHNADFSDFPAIYSLAKVFVYPSVFEGFGIPILEALNVGVPVIAANTASLPEVGGSAIRYISPYNYNELANHISELMDSKYLYNEAVEQGKIRAAKFREEKVIADLWEIYQELMAMPKRKLS